MFHHCKRKQSHNISIHMICWNSQDATTLKPSRDWIMQVLKGMLFQTEELHLRSEAPTENTVVDGNFPKRESEESPFFFSLIGQIGSIGSMLSFKDTQILNRKGL